MRFVCAYCAIILLATSIYAEARDVGVGSMLVGEQMLEVSEVRQLSLKADGKVKSISISPDGKYLAYVIESETRIELRLSKTTTGKTITILSQLTNEKTLWDNLPASGGAWMVTCLDERTSQAWLSLEKLGVAWSPDSKSFAFLAMRVELGKGVVDERPLHALVYNAAGSLKTSLLLPKYIEVVERPLFTPDSRQLVLNLVLKVGAELGDITEHRPIVQSIDIATGASRDLYASPAAIPNLVGWSDAGSLLCVVYDKAGRHLHEIALDGGSDQVTLKNCAEVERTSPNGTLAVSDSQGLTIINQMTAKKIELTKSDRVSFLVWAPSGKMLLFGKYESIADAPKSRERYFMSLWLSATTAGKLNQMCVALDFEGTPSASRDCSRIAYVSQGQLYIAELSLREPTVDEKLAAGINLTEEEMKQELSSNGKQIGIAIKMYSDDYDGKLPPADSVAEAIHDNLREVNVFFRPGTQDSIFKYIDPRVAKLSEITNESDTIIGELDAGYGWKVVVYADTHTEVKTK